MRYSFGHKRLYGLTRACCVARSLASWGDIWIEEKQATHPKGAKVKFGGGVVLWHPQFFASQIRPRRYFYSRFVLCKCTKAAALHHIAPYRTAPSAADE